MKGLEIFALPEWKGLPTLLRCYAKAGWFEGSVFFAIASESSPPFPSAARSSLAVIRVVTRADRANDPLYNRPVHVSTLADSAITVDVDR